MGFIQKILAPIVDKQPQVDTFNNPHIKIISEGRYLGTFECMIGDNYVKKLILKSSYSSFLRSNLYDLNLQFLVEASYKASAIEILPVEHGSDMFKVKFFNGTLNSGDIVCEEFIGDVNGGTVDGTYLVSSGDKIVHPGVFVKGIYDKHFYNEVGHVDCDKSIFGLKPYNEMTLNKSTADKNISILALNNNQTVVVTNDKDEEFSFTVHTSYKKDGKCMKVVEDGELKEITWQSIRRSNTPNYNKTGFDQRSQLRIGKKFYIPTLFDGKDVGTIKQIKIINSEDDVQYNSSSQNNENVNFVPKKFKI